jgi:hypothetical protein
MDHSADAIERSDVRMEGNDLIIRAPKSMALLLKDSEVQRAAAQLLGKPVRVRIESSEEKPAESRAGGETELRERALSHPGVKRFQELFPGAQVRTVRNLNE